MVEFLKKNLFPIIFISFVLFFYYPFIINGKLPIPTDTIVGLYHPYRDLLSGEFPNGYPFKNFLITDPVRQTYIWKELSTSMLQSGVVPIWNPYEMAGKPLLANFQAGSFYPLNIILFFNPFYLSWSVFIMSQSLLGGYFVFLYLRNLNLDKKAVIIALLSFIFSGFFTAWLEWGTVIQTAIWLPLILFSIDKIIRSQTAKSFSAYSLLLAISLVSSFLAGHLQIFFYIFIVSIFYFLSNLFIYRKQPLKKIIIFSLVLIAFILVTAIQWIPTLQFINLSARSIDQNYLNVEGFFLPLHHLIQIVSPDFFGNVTTLNYWGTWNYGELVLYIGIIPLIFSVSAIFIKRKRTYFFIVLLFLSLLFSLPNFISELPFNMNLPLLSSSQPTRLLLMATFSLSVLSAFGFDAYIKSKNKKPAFISAALILAFIIFLWVLVFLGDIDFFKNKENSVIAFRNLILPTIITFLTLTALIFQKVFNNKKILNFVLFTLILLTGFDLYRFSSKFNVFDSSRFLYPETKIVSFLKQDKNLFRISSVDDRILPPNFLTYYRLQTIEGYDPLYLKSYGQFISSMERNNSEISQQFGFNRIITPSNFESSLYDFLNVKYVLSLSELESEKLELIMEEGQTKLYENKKVLPRLFFVENIVTSMNDEDAMEKILNIDLRKTAVVNIDSNDKVAENAYSVGDVKVISYTENEVVIQTQNTGSGFLVFADAFYPTWHAKINGQEITIFRTNYSFRGIVVPEGKNKITFYTNLF